MNDFDNGRIRLMQGDCLERMKEIPDQSIDLILTDPPYGITASNWDSIINLDEMWHELRRISKDNTAIVIFAAQPFTSKLVISNLKWFRYSLVWNKVGTTGFATSRIMPLKKHEDILVFYKKKPTYNPIMEERGKKRKKGGSKKDNGCYGELRSSVSYNNLYYPTSIIEISNASKKKTTNHPNEKPIQLLEYLIRTYTNEDEIVLDFTFGSCSTGIAAVNTNRRFIGIELDETYYQVGLARVQNHLEELAGRML